MNQNPSSFPPPGPLPADPKTSIGRRHVESEQSLHSTESFPESPFFVEHFCAEGQGVQQILSEDAETGEATIRLLLKKGWRAPIGHFSTDVEIFVLRGALRQGGFALRKLTYSFLPAGMPVGPWVAEEDTLLLFMPDARPSYDPAPYAELEQIPENSVYHRAAQDHPRMGEYLPANELNAMSWEQTTFLPPGSARKSLYTNKQTGRATWVLGLVPMWVEGNFYAGHPTIEEAYCILGDVQGHWSMQDDPFERRYAAMRADGYYWRPAHVPHGPFWTEEGSLLLFRTKERLDCYWLLHSTDIEQRYSHLPRPEGGEG